MIAMKVSAMNGAPLQRVLGLIVPPIATCKPDVNVCKKVLWACRRIAGRRNEKNRAYRFVVLSRKHNRGDDDEMLAVIALFGMSLRPTSP